VGAGALCGAGAAPATAVKGPSPGVPSPGCMVLGRCLRGVRLRTLAGAGAGAGLAPRRRGQQQAGEQQDTKCPKPLHAVAVPCEMPGTAEGESKAWRSHDRQRCRAVPCRASLAAPGAVPGTGPGTPGSPRPPAPKGCSCSSPSPAEPAAWAHAALAAPGTICT